VATVRFTLAPPRPFRLRVALFGHGWIDLAPHSWDERARRFTTVLALGREAADVELVQRGPRLIGTIAAKSGADGSGDRSRLRAAVRPALRRMLRLDHDYAPFWRLCTGEERLRWVARRGAGRLLAGATLFEDLLKLLLTTNCSWAATRLMASRLADALGPRAPSGRPAFPDAARCAAQPESFWRDVVRAGYRARACRELSERFAADARFAGRFEDATLATAELRDRLKSLHGFGPYATGQALRLLGRHDDLALDSWCRAKLAQQSGAKRPPADQRVERAYAGYAEHRGLVLWMDLTREWHGEAPLCERDAVVASLRRPARRG
jgi:3-methyladenine DNA glycosylase/8-oxoguanine DNA glycosylase